MTSTYLAGDSRINIHIEKGSLVVSNHDLMEWVRRASESVTAYYGRYPVPSVLLRVVPSNGKGLRGGQTFGEPEGGFIRVQVGSETTNADLENDWLLTHEMVHLALPSVADKHHWIEEGIATYVEPIARVRAGHLDAHVMWYELMRDLPQGLPNPGDKGLDNTHTWGRTYWGGAMFCLFADVEIRKETKGQKGLQDALRAIVDAGGTIDTDWSISRAFDVGDKATGTKVLSQMYARWGGTPVTTDLDALWKELGAKEGAHGVEFDAKAPLAGVREAITRAR